MKKKIVAVILCCMMACSIIACGSPSQNETSNGAGNETISSEAEADNPASSQTQENNVPPTTGSDDTANSDTNTTDSNTSSSEKENFRVVPIYFEGDPDDILSQKVNMSRDSYYRKTTSDYMEHEWGITDIHNYDYFFQTDQKYYSAEDFADCSDDLLLVAKNEIYARHGRMFDNQDLYLFFLSKMWYVPRFTPEEFDESWLNVYEKANLKLLIELTEGMETKTIPDSKIPASANTTPVANNQYLFQTDTRYYTVEDFADCTKEELRLAKNEIYARHGYVFEDKELKAYFLEQMWYVPRLYDGFDENLLNDCERENLKILLDLGA